MYRQTPPVPGLLSPRHLRILGHGDLTRAQPGDTALKNNMGLEHLLRSFVGIPLLLIYSIYEIFINTTSCVDFVVKSAVSFCKDFC